MFSKTLLIMPEMSSFRIAIETGIKVKLIFIVRSATMTTVRLGASGDCPVSAMTRRAISGKLRITYEVERSMTVLIKCRLVFCDFLFCEMVFTSRDVVSCVVCSPPVCAMFEVTVFIVDDG